MPDHLSRAGRSRVMAAIRSTDTKPELALRAELRRRRLTGYRLYRCDLPGKPDLAYVRWHVAVFVDDVFWHAGTPSTSTPVPPATTGEPRSLAPRSVTRPLTGTCRRPAGRSSGPVDLEVRSGVGDVADRVELALHAAGRPEGSVRSIAEMPGAA